MEAYALRLWLEEQFQKHPDKKKTALAEALNLEPPAISKILKGDRQIKATELVQIEKFFGASAQNVIGSTSPGEMHYAQRNAKHETLSDAQNIITPQWDIPADILGAKTNAESKDIKNFRVNDAMMAPEFNRGEYVMVNIGDTSLQTPGTFMVSDGMHHMIRNCEIVMGSDPAEVKITALKKGFQAQKLKLDELIVLGRVIAKLQWL